MSDATPDPERARPLLRAGIGLGAYGLLLLCFFTFGVWLQTWHLIAGLWLSEIVCIAAPALLAIWAANARPGPLLGLRAPSWKMVGLAVLIGLLNQPVVSLLEQVAHSSLPEKLVADFDAKNVFLDGIFRRQAWSMLAAVTIAAPLCEELFFRGFLQPALGRTLPAIFAALVSGALFSAIHVDPVGFLGLWEIGFVLAVVRHRSGSVWTAVILHAINNGAAGGAFLAGWQDATEPPPMWVLILGGVLLIIGIIWAVKVLRAPSPIPSRELRASEGPRADRFSLLRAWPLLVPLAASVAFGLWRLALIATQHK